MTNNTAVSDEELVSALLSNGTIKAAAAAVGISERSLYDRMNQGEFIALYKSAKADIIRAAVINLNRHIQTATETIIEIMTDPENNAAIRLQAAQTILKNADRLADRLSYTESSVTAQIENNNLFYGYDVNF